MEDLSYIQISGWMINKLKLSGNELMIYALIFGFSHDGESSFEGGHKYICDSINASRPTVSKCLSNLEELGYIEKHQTTINGVNFNRYKVSLQVVKNLYIGSKESLHNNIYNSNILLDKPSIINNKPSREKKTFVPPTLTEVTAFFKEKKLSPEYAKIAYEHYESADWIDTSGKPVISWKQKMLTNWINGKDTSKYRIEEEDLFSGQKPNKKPQMIY